MFKPKKQTSYKLALKKNLIYEYCSEQYSNSTGCDFFFFCSDRVVQAHISIIVLSCKLIKQTMQPNSISIIDSVYLPDYNSSTVETFVKFLYTGELVISEHQYPDFQSLCKEFLVDFPDVVFEGCASASANEELIHEVEALSEDESQEEEIIDESFEDMDVDAKDSTEYETFNEPSRIEKSNSKSHKRSKSRHTITTLKEPAEIKDSLQSAIDAIQSGKMNTLQAAKRFKIPKTTLYRWTSKVSTSKSSFSTTRKSSSTSTSLIEQVKAEDVS